MIRYKVVTKNRKSVNSRRNSIIVKGYIRIYKKGKIVNAVPGSFGLYCFKTEDDARDFMYKMQGEFGGPYMIIRVKPIGRGSSPKYVFSLSFRSLKSFYEKYKAQKTTRIYSTWKIPKGTICYQSVKVLD